MAEEVTEPPTLTAKDVEKVTALIDPEPLPCGGRGLTRTAPRTVRWSFGKRSTFAVARFHLGMGWPAGSLRRTCPMGIDRCFTHRADDPTLPPPSARGTDEPSNTVTGPQDRAPTAPDGKGVADGVRADEALLRGWTWATGATPARRANPTPDPQHGATSPPPSGLTPPLAPAPGAWHQGGDSPLAPKRGQGVELHHLGDRGQGTGATEVTTPRRPRRRKLALSRGAKGRAAKTAVAVAVALSLIFLAARGIDRLDRIGTPTGITPSLPGEAPQPTQPSLPPTPTEPVPAAPSSSSIGPIFRACPPSWETTTAPIAGCP